MEKYEIRYLLAMGHSKLDIIKKIRKNTNFTLSVKDSSEIVDQCLPVMKRIGKLLGCAGAEEGCVGYPKCFEVETCLTSS